jgi:hypothetical protein
MAGDLTPEEDAELTEVVQSSTETVDQFALRHRNKIAAM